MRLFQNSGIYPSYRRHFDRRNGTNQDFASRRRAFLADRFGAAHFLQPVLQGGEDAFFTNGDDDILQRAWARENGLPAASDLESVLLAQIEAHRAEIFYNLDPLRFGSAFIRRLPGCVRHSLAWRAAPSPGADFAAYARVLCNFPSILESYRKRGWSAAYFAPAHDPVLDAFASETQRPVDVLFVGGYSRHHQRRAAILEAVASLAPRRVVSYHLDCSRLTRLAESALGRLLPLAAHRRPPVIRNVSAGPLFGLDLYRALSQARIVLNCAIDMAGEDRGNMRCFEAMGSGAVMVSDRGKYPEGMVDGRNFLSFADSSGAVQAIGRLLADDALRAGLAVSGLQVMRDLYNKASQWAAFQKVVGAL